MNLASEHIGRKIVGVGVDIVHLPRFARLLEKYSPLSPVASSTFKKITQKFMLERERAHLEISSPKNNIWVQACTNTSRVIWALKECSLKALCCHISKHDLPPAQVVYSRMLYKTQNSAGVPKLEYDKMFEQEYSKYRQFSKNYGSFFSTHEFLVSLSHDKDYLIAMVNLVERQ